jgi:hypothetical protein
MVISAHMITFAENPNPPEFPGRILSKQQAAERLQPYLEILDECIQGGWDAWDKHYSHRHHVLDARARAAIVFCEIVAIAQPRFHGMDGAKAVKKQNSFYLYIGDEIVLRFKKINKKGRCSNIDTRQQMLFELQMQLPGIESGTLLHAGYRLDDLQTRIAEKLVVCQFASRVLWAFDLSKPKGERVRVMQPRPQPETPTGPRWEAKPEAEKKRKQLAKAKPAGKE